MMLSCRTFLGSRLPCVPHKKGKILVCSFSFSHLSAMSIKSNQQYWSSLIRRWKQSCLTLRRLDDSVQSVSVQGQELKSLERENIFQDFVIWSKMLNLYYSTFYGISLLQMLQIYKKELFSNHIITTQLENYACETMRFENLPLIIQFSLAHLA